MALPGLDEVVVRRYTLKPESPSRQDSQQQLSFSDAGAAPKPPGAGLSGSVFEATLQLQQAVGGSGGSSSISAQSYVQQVLTEVAAGARPGDPAPHTQLLASPDQAVACLQQVLGMLRTLAPPVRLLMRLTDVAMQASQPASRLLLMPKSSLAWAPLLGSSAVHAAVAWNNLEQD